MKVYTKTGDNGTTSLIGGRRVLKSSSRIEAYGTIDELMAFIGHLLDNIDISGNTSAQEYIPMLETILNQLMNLGSHLASEGNGIKHLPELSDRQISFLEENIDTISESLKPITNFTLPCGHPIVSLCHICRTICRRAERQIIRATEQNNFDDNLLMYINRLSDLLYVFGRRMSVIFNTKEYYWVANK